MFWHFPVCLWFSGAAFVNGYSNLCKHKSKSFLLFLRLKCEKNYLSERFNFVICFVMNGIFLARNIHLKKFILLGYNWWKKEALVALCGFRTSAISSLLPKYFFFIQSTGFYFLWNTTTFIYQNVLFILILFFFQF